MAQSASLPQRGKPSRALKLAWAEGAALKQENAALLEAPAPGGIGGAVKAAIAEAAGQIALALSPFRAKVAQSASLPLRGKPSRALGGEPAGEALAEEAPGEGPEWESPVDVDRLVKELTDRQAAASGKIAGFPPHIRELIDRLLGQTPKNYSFIARAVTAQGYQITSVSIKRYEEFKLTGKRQREYKRRGEKGAGA